MPQSIKTKDILYYSNKYSKELKEKSYKKYLKYTFEIGEEVDQDKYLYDLMMVDLFCNSSCDVNNLIQDKINGTYKNKTLTYNYTQNNQEQEYQSCSGNECSIKIEW